MNCTIHTTIECFQTSKQAFRLNLTDSSVRERGKLHG